MTTEELRIEKSDHILTIAIDRPERRNALTLDQLNLISTPAFAESRLVARQDRP